MSTISLKNHLNHADGTRSIKVNGNTVLCPLISESVLKSNNITLTEINFKAADKINVIFTLPTNDPCDATLFQNAIQVYNDTVTAKSFKSTQAAVLSHKLITDEEVDVSDAVLDALFVAKINKGNQKGDKYDAEIQFKKALPTATASKPTPVAAAKTPEQTTAKAASPPQQTTVAQEQKTAFMSRANPNKEASQLLADRVLASILTQKTPIDLAALAKTYQLNAELEILKDQIAIAKNKEKAALQTQIDAITTQLTTLQPQYDAIRTTLAQELLPEVVVVTNQAYSKGMNSVVKK